VKQISFSWEADFLFIGVRIAFDAAPSEYRSATFDRFIKSADNVSTPFL